MSALLELGQHDVEETQLRACLYETAENLVQWLSGHVPPDIGVVEIRLAHTLAKLHQKVVGFSPLCGLDLVILIPWTVIWPIWARNARGNRHPAS
jgi:hypothetical protein